MTQDEIFNMAVKCYLISTGNREGFYGDALIQFAKMVAEAERERIKQANAPEIEKINAYIEHAMSEVQRLGQEIEQEPVWIDAGNLKRLKKGDVLRVFRKGQEYYSAFRFDGLLQECDYTYDGDAPFVWLEVGMATLDKIVYTKKDFTTGAVYADRGDRVELFQPAIKEALAQPEQEPVAWMDADGNVSDNNDHKCFPIPLYTKEQP